MTIEDSLSCAEFFTLWLVAAPESCASATLVLRLLLPHLCLLAFVILP